MLLRDDNTSKKFYSTQHSALRNQNSFNPYEGDIPGLQEDFSVGETSAHLPDVDALGGELVFVVAVPADGGIIAFKDLVTKTVKYTQIVFKQIP